ncbi:Csa1 family protein [Staphylococcus aureus]
MKKEIENSKFFVQYGNLEKILKIIKIVISYNPNVQLYPEVI